jgi:hypothetical protein
MTTPTHMDDLIDSRDVIARIEELTDERAAIVDATDDEDENEEYREAARAELTEWDEDNLDELQSLQDLAKQGEDYAADWQYGETLIRDSYFKEYAMELADDIGAINSEASWPNTCIDWDQAAKELQMDYSSIEFDGTTYWVR